MPPKAASSPKAIVGVPSRDGVISEGELHRTSRRGSSSGSSKFATHKSAATAGDEYNVLTTNAGEKSEGASSSRKSMTAEERAELKARKARQEEDADHCSALLAKRLQSVECRQAGLTKERLDEEIEEQLTRAACDEELARKLQNEAEDEAEAEADKLVAQELAALDEELARQLQEEDGAELARQLQQAEEQRGHRGPPRGSNSGSMPGRDQGGMGELALVGGQLVMLGSGGATDLDLATGLDADLLLALQLSQEDALLQSTGHVGVDRVPFIEGRDS